MPIAAIDIGNTHTKVGLYQGRRLLRSFSIPTENLGSANSRWKKAEAVLVSSVVPRAVNVLNHPRLLLMGKDFAPLVGVKVDRPGEVGMDRLANASAAFARSGGPCIVVDAGTAVTFDVVDARGRFIGGLIAPGMRLGARVLTENTALLPPVRPEKPSRIIARGTMSNIQSGLYWSLAGLIEVGLREARRELGRRAPVWGTGGDAALFRKYFTHVVPHLALEGIRISYERACCSNHSARKKRHRGR